MVDILALVPYPVGTAGGQRTSIESWAPILADQGIAVHFVPFATADLYADLYVSGGTRAKATGLLRGYVDRVQLLLRDLASYDGVFVYREAALVGPEILERMLKRRGLPIIYGLDDPLFVPYRSPVNGGLSRLKFPGKVARLCALATAVIVNSTRLRKFAAKYNGNVWVVPNLVDEAAYQPEPRPRGDPPCLGWIGSHSSASNLDLLAEPLSELARRVDFDVHLVGARRPAVGGVSCVSKSWSEASEVRDLRLFDAGLLPLNDHPWNAWKFNFKLAQYMALGIPPVCTPIGDNAEVIQHGTTGFLASTSDDWVRYLEALITNDQLRQEMGAAAATYAHHHFTLGANQETIVGAFRSALKRTRVGSR
jgi:glycosyltransferase involved in cell wall biosynthesis